MLYPFSIPEARFFSFAVLVPRTSSCRTGAPGAVGAQNMRLMISRFLNVGKDCHVAEQLTGANRFCRLAVSEIHDFTGKEDEVGGVLANEEGESTIEHKSDLFAKCRAGR